MKEMKKILVVDNHPLILKYIKDLLGKRGHKVLTARDGLSALNILKKITPDIIFVDLIMPNIDGRKLCRIIHKMPALRHAYIVVLSAIAAEEIEKTPGLDDIEADAYIVKGPFDKMGRHILAVLDQVDQKGSTGQPKEILGLEDVHPRQITRELLSAKKYSDAIMENIDEGIIEITSDARIVYTNSVTASLSGIPEERLLASNFVNIFKESQRPKIKALLGSKEPPLQAFTKESPALINNREFEVRILPFIEGEHKFIVILKDVTRERKRDAQIQRALKMETIGRLAGGIAHEFNNLLMGIQGNASLILLDILSTSPYHKRLKNIERLVQDGSTLTSQLLKYAREERYQPRPINLNELIEDTSDTFGKARRDIKVHRELASDLFMVEVDKRQMEQVLLNLYVNAADAMPGGGELFLKTMNLGYKEIDIEAHKLKPGNYVELIVTDTGIGMDRETLERIFDPFFTTKEIGQGTGLGLASVYGTIEEHGGCIDVESEKGKGTSFKIYLPAIEPEGKKGQPILRDKMILVVDDEELVRKVIQEMLKTMGYEVLTAKDGREAIRLYKRYQASIDLVLLDIIMPDMGGKEVYRYLKKIDPGVRALLLSGYNMDRETMEIIAQGRSGFIQKPFSFEDLAQEINKILKTGDSLESKE